MVVRFYVLQLPINRILCRSDSHTLKENKLRTVLTLWIFLWIINDIAKSAMWSCLLFPWDSFLALAPTKKGILGAPEEWPPTNRHLFECLDNRTNLTNRDLWNKLMEAAWTWQQMITIMDQGYTNKQYFIIKFTIVPQVDIYYRLKTLRFS